MTTIAIIGLGGHAVKNTLPALNDAPNLNLVGCFTRNQERRLEIAQQYQIKYWETEDEVYTAQDVDAIYLATPTGVHYEQVKQALEHGKHVFCEKSFVTTANEAKELCALAERKGLFLAECFMYLYHSQFRRVHELCTEGALGQIHQVTARFGYPHLPPDNIRYNAALGGGALLDAAVYPLSALYALSDGNCSHLDGHAFTEDGYEVDTHGAASFIGENQMIGHAQWGMGRDYSNDIVIWGSQGQMLVERAFSKPPSLETRVQISRNGKVETITIEPDNHFIQMFEAFASSIGNDEKHQLHRKQIVDMATLLEQIRSNRAIRQ